ncbi:hypothetical protein KY349_05700 [Candidatus Woesearchaeota archaeon]|jgi:hypothetical protein|nr:hypothetical protein [Candidatus Woesearchaeota archaeon]
MINKKIAMILSFALILIILTGCGTFQRGRDEPYVSAEFAATGTEGIVMLFVPDQPPPKVYTQSPLSFLVEVRNRGTYTVPSATFYLSGYDPNIIPGLPPAYPLLEPLEGKSQFNPEGGYTTLEFTSPTVNLPNTMPNYRPTFLLTACYPYNTVATPLVCVDPNPLDPTPDKACIARKAYGTGSQGAPVVVDSIEAEARPSGMFFRIHVANTAGGTQQASGTVFDQTKLGACPVGLQYRDLNMLNFEVSIAGQPLECEPRTGELRLSNQRGTIFCKFLNVPNIPAYQTALEVRLMYGYKSSISKMVDIENLNFAR